MNVLHETNPTAGNSEPRPVSSAAQMPAFLRWWLEYQQKMGDQSGAAWPQGCRDHEISRSVDQQIQESGSRHERS